MIKKSVLLLAVAALSAAFFFITAGMQKAETPVPVKDTEKNLFPFVRSLQGTATDGKLEANANGDLIASAELRRMFDYYLSALGEKSLEAIRAEIEKELDRKLQPGAAASAKDLLGRYLAYKRELADVEKNSQLAGNSAASIRGRYAAMQIARGHFFSSAESQAMFGFDDAYDKDAVARLEISQDNNLSDAQKKAKLAALDAAMPPALREEKEAPFIVVKLEEKANVLRAQGGSEDDVYRMRAATVSPEAAARLAEVDREDAEWKNRISAYQAARRQILGSGGDNSLAIQQLRDRQFTASEQKRLAAYE
ncbi:lipase secretion chaperone [Undibacterium terreum]|nr:lipase secretion chaperone [Undibacterium terreum]